MYSVEPHRKDLFTQKEVPEVGPGKISAGIAAATRVERSGVPFEFGPLDADPSPACKKSPIPRVSCGHDAIEHIEAAFDRDQHVPKITHAHQVSRMVCRHLWADN